MKNLRDPDTIHAPLAPYSHQIEVTGDERWLVVSGQVGRTVEGAIPERPGEQLGVALDNVLRNLEAAGMSASDLVKLTFYLTEAVPADERSAVIEERLGSHRPCMTLLYVAGLAAPPLKVEVDAWAAAA